MGYRRGWGPDLNRSFRAGSKLADDITKGLLLGGLVGADYIYRKTQQPRTQYRPLTKGELQEVEKWELQHAKPFSFTKTIILHSIFSIFVFVAPLLGILLYSYDWWMFFCVLTSGFLEFVLDWPAILLPDNIRSDWRFDKNNEQKQKKQIKTLLWLAIFTNIILIILNSYPFILMSSKITPNPYEGGLLVSLMTMFLYFMNGSLIYENAKILRNLDKYFEQNANKFSRLHNTKDVHNETEHPIVQSNDSLAIPNNGIEQIQTYIDRCNSEQISLEVIKANIRILNAMTDSYKKGNSELTNSILELRLEEKINSAKRDFVKRECRLALEIINILKTQSVDDVITSLKQEYPY